MKRQREDEDVADDNRSASDQQQSGKQHKKQHEKNDTEDLPKGVIVYTQDTIPWDLQKYWQQRHKLFSKFNQGVWLTDEGWYSVTPERVAKKISDHIFRSSNTSTKRLVVDGFCGLGGNVIQFALSPQCSKVIAIDNDAAMLACARRNAQIYGVEHKIEFIEIDFFEYTRKRTDSQPDVPVDYVFLSPPWGGPSYRHDEIFDLEKMEPHSGSSIFNAAKLLSSNIALYLPRNSDLRQLATMVPTDETIQAIHYCLNSRSKALCAYFGTKLQSAAFDFGVTDRSPSTFHMGDTTLDGNVLIVILDVASDTPVVLTRALASYPSHSTWDF